MCVLNKIVIGILGALGVILFILGFVLGFKVFPDVVKEQIAKSVRLEPGTEQWDRFVELPFPLTFKVYMFEVTNPDAVMAGAKPVVREVGPYVYKQFRRKVEIEENDATLGYYQYQYYEFDTMASFPLHEEDKITMLNVPLNGVFQIAEKEMSPAIIKFLNAGWPSMFPDTKSMFHTVRVHDYLFGGYKFCDASKTTPQGHMSCQKVRVRKAKTMEVQEDKSVLFSFFNFKNKNHDGYYKVGSGMTEEQDVGNIKEWENQKYTDFWVGENSTCAEVKGTDSTIFPPHSDEHTVFDVFSTDICRSVQLKFKETIEYKGISGFRNEMARDALNSGSSTHENSCFCIKQTRNLAGHETCNPDGFNDMFNCLGAPVLLSFPHFLWAQEEYAATVAGVQADESKHVTFVEYEPDTGTPLRGAKRVQFNMIIRDINSIEITQSITPAILPLVWVEEGMELTDELVYELKSKYLSKLPMVAGVQWGLVVLGVLLILASIGSFVYRKKNAKSFI